MQDGGAFDPYFKGMTAMRKVPTGVPSSLSDVKNPLFLSGRSDCWNIAAKNAVNHIKNLCKTA
jgi:hypothetical protein